MMHRVMRSVGLGDAAVERHRHRRRLGLGLARQDLRLQLARAQRGDLFQQPYLGVGL